MTPIFPRTVWSPPPPPPPQLFLQKNFLNDMGQHTCSIPLFSPPSLRFSSPVSPWAPISRPGLTSVPSAGRPQPPFPQNKRIRTNPKMRNLQWASPKCQPLPPPLLPTPLLRRACAFPLPSACNPPAKPHQRHSNHDRPRTPQPTLSNRCAPSSKIAPPQNLSLCQPRLVERVRQTTPSLPPILSNRPPHCPFPHLPPSPPARFLSASNPCLPGPRPPL